MVNLQNTIRFSFPIFKYQKIINERKSECDKDSQVKRLDTVQKQIDKIYMMINNAW